MLEQITWSRYWTTIGATTVIYYAGIGLLFYRKKIISAFNQTSPLTNNTNTTPENVMGAILSEPNIEEAQSSEAALSKDQTEDQSAEIQTDVTAENVRTLDKTTKTGDLITEALSEIGVNTNSDELVTAISSIIKKHNANGGLTPFREALDWHIHQTALDSCGIALEKEELDTIWSSP